MLFFQKVHYSMWCVFPAGSFAWVHLSGTSNAELHQGITQQRLKMNAVPSFLPPSICKWICRSPALTDAWMNTINSQLSSLHPSPAVSGSLSTCKFSFYMVGTCVHWNAMWVSIRTEVKTLLVLGLTLKRRFKLKLRQLSWGRKQDTNTGQSIHHRCTQLFPNCVSHAFGCLNTITLKEMGLLPSQAPQT